MSMIDMQDLQYVLTAIAPLDRTDLIGITFWLQEDSLLVTSLNFSNKDRYLINITGELVKFNTRIAMLRSIYPRTGKYISYFRSDDSFYLSGSGEYNHSSVDRIAG